jgi:membrane protein
VERCARHPRPPRGLTILRLIKHRVKGHIGPGTRAFRVMTRVAAGAWNDGTIHAGNLAYMSLLAIFPFFIVGAAVFQLFGEEADRAALVAMIVRALPPVVAEVIEPVARDVMELRSGWLLWAGAIVGLWTMGGLMETIRDIFHRAYEASPALHFWHYRLISTGIIIAAVLLILVSLFAQVAIGAAQEVIVARFPHLGDVLSSLTWSRVITGFGLYGAIYLLFYSLTPEVSGTRICPKWPGALLVTLWWMSATVALPPLLRSVFTYNLTYGSLAGIMITLFFFWLVGLGMVVGAELNAALAETPPRKKGDMAANMEE